MNEDRLPLPLGSAGSIRVALADAFGRLTPENPFDVIFEQGDDITVELYAPVEADHQKPHDRDELYIVVTGQGSFSCGDRRVPFGPGDLLYAPAHTLHRFEDFSDDFKVWVIFYGPRRPLVDESW